MTDLRRHYVGSVCTLIRTEMTSLAMDQTTCRKFTTSVRLAMEADVSYYVVIQKVMLLGV